jgi:hypothetical protein
MASRKRTANGHIAGGAASAAAAAAAADASSTHATNAAACASAFFGLDGGQRIVTYQCRSCLRTLGDSTALIDQYEERLVLDVGSHLSIDPSRQAWISPREPTSSSSLHHQHYAPELDALDDALEWRLGVKYSRIECSGCSAVVGRVWRTQPADPARQYAGKIMLDCSSLSPEPYIIGSGSPADSSGVEADGLGHGPGLVESVMTILLAQREQLQAHAEEINVLHEDLATLYAWTREKEARENGTVAGTGGAKPAYDTMPRIQTALPPRAERPAVKAAAPVSAAPASAAAAASSSQSLAAFRASALNGRLTSNGTVAAASSATSASKPPVSGTKRPAPAAAAGPIYSTSPITSLPGYNPSFSSAGAPASQSSAPLRYYEAPEEDLEEADRRERDEEEEVTPKGKAGAQQASKKQKTASAKRM